MMSGSEKTVIVFIVVAGAVMGGVFTQAIRDLCNRRRGPYRITKQFGDSKIEVEAPSREEAIKLWDMVTKFAGRTNAQP